MGEAGNARSRHELTIFESSSAMDQHVAEVERPVEPTPRTHATMLASSRAANCVCIFSPSFATPVILLILPRALAKSARRMLVGSTATPMMTPARQSRADASARMMPDW